MSTPEDQATLLANAIIHPMVEPGRTADAMVIRADRIVAVGELADMRQIAGSNAHEYDLEGRCLIPGFTDCHAHLENLDRYDRTLDGSPTRQHLLNGLRAAQQSGCGSATWLIVAAVVDDAVIPTGAELDQVCPDRPAVLILTGGRYLLNSHALPYLDATLAARDGAVLERDSSGRATGYVTTRGEDRLKYLMPDAPLYDAESVGQALSIGLRNLVVNGITNVHHVVKDKLPIEAYRTLLAERKLPVRVGLLLRIWESELSLADIPAIALGSQAHDMLRLQGVKISIDGYFPAGGARYSQDYEDEPGNRGTLRIGQGDLDRLTAQAHDAGLRIALHANGDEALDAAITALERAVGASTRTDHRHRIEHFSNQFCTDEHIARAAAIGAVAVPNPPFIDSRAQHLLRRLGPLRGSRPLPVRTMLAHRLRVGLGSDYVGLQPVSPLAGMRILASRRSASGQLYAPDQAVSTWQALRMYTADNAWVSFDESHRGVLAPGYLADLVLLGADPLAIDATELDDIAVLSTMVGGSWTHATPDAPVDTTAA